MFIPRENFSHRVKSSNYSIIQSGLKGLISWMKMINDKVLVQNWPLQKIPQHTIILFVWHPKILHKHCSLGTFLTPKRNWRQCSCKTLGWQTKSIMVCYGIFWSGQFQLWFLLIPFSLFEIRNYFGNASCTAASNFIKDSTDGDVAQ